MSLVNFPRAELNLFQFEERCTPATLVVSDAKWDAATPNTLPWAIAQANSPAYPGQDDIVFDYSATGLNSNTPVFTPLSTLVVTHGVKIHAGVSGQYAKFQNGVRPFEFDHFLAPAGQKESELRGGMFVNCTAGAGDGGAVKVTNGQLTVASSRFDENKAQKGGAIFVAAEGTLIVTSNPGNVPADPGTHPSDMGSREVTLFYKNEAANRGGAIAIEGETHLLRTWIVQNKSAGDGGGVHVASQGKVYATPFQEGGMSFNPDVEFRRNEAKFNGGGVYYGSAAS